MKQDEKWPIVRLADVAEHCLGKMLDAKKNKGSPHPYLRNPNVRWFHVDTTDLQTMPFEDREVDRYGLRSGDIVICEGGDAGRAAIWDGRIPNLKFQKAIHRVRPGPKLYNRYFVHRLMSDQKSGRLSDYLTGTTIKHFTGQDLARYAFPLPPIDEQRRIAELLDRAEALRTKRRVTLAQLDTLTQAIFLMMFGDPVRNPNHWEWRTLGSLTRRKLNNGIFRKNTDYVESGSVGTPVVWVEDLFRGESLDVTGSRRLLPTDSELDRYGLKTGDLLFCRSSLKLDGIAYNNVYLGKDDCAIFECHIIRMSPNTEIVLPVFLNCLLRFPQLREIAKSKAKTATMTTIDQENLAAIRVPVPPLSLQSEFEARSAQLQQLKRAARDSLRELDLLYSSLQQRAFRGEI